MTFLPQIIAQEVLYLVASINTMSSLDLGQPAIKYKIHRVQINRQGEPGHVVGSGLDCGSSAGHGSLQPLPFPDLSQLHRRDLPVPGIGSGRVFQSLGQRMKTQQVTHDRYWASPKSLRCQRNQK